MTNFKVGDKVRRVKMSYDLKDFGVLWEVYTVISVNGDTVIEIIAGHFGASENFELVTEEANKK